jgi:hypothetical protein
MVIESRQIVGAAAALALVGGVLWGSSLMFSAPAAPMHQGTVEVTQIPERSWTVEVKDLGFDQAAADTKTARR